MTPKPITSPSNQIIKDIKALEMRKRRKETNLFLVEGLRSVIEGVELGSTLKYIAYHTNIKDKDELKRCVSYCNDCGGYALEVNDLVLEKLSRKDNPQSVIGVFTQTFHKLENIDKNDTGRNYIALEKIRDPGNLGTIIRTIDAIGAHGVILIDQCCDPYSVETVRATMGSIFSVPIFQTTLDEFKIWSKDWQGDVIGTTLQSSVDFREITPKKPLLLMMGNEQAGLSEDLRQLATYCIRLPMNGRADSLNLSVATGICLYALLEPWK
ncbi:MAG: RNA methyltransferase [Alphaproteobacteria bacterium]|nr:RNA methyltransferase [Alphaproteobacteria bacterium]MCB9985170.1 RNA methyltransferase [Micavibrio sp.]